METTTTGPGTTPTTHHHQPGPPTRPANRPAGRLEPGGHGRPGQQPSGHTATVSLFVVGAVGHTPAPGSSAPASERIDLTHCRRARDGFVYRLPGGRLAAVVTVRGRDAAGARGEADRALSRVWPGAFEDAVVTVQELHRRRRG